MAKKLPKNQPPELDKKMLDRAICALKQTWNAIGYDCIQANDGRDMKGDEVQDCVASCGFKTGYPWAYGNDKEAVAWLQNLTWKEQEFILNMAFPKNGRFGL